MKSKLARLAMEEKNIDAQEGVARLRGVRRRLFPGNDEGNQRGAEDNLDNLIFEEAQNSRKNAKERWNFDFENEVPLPGRYDWVKIDQDGNEIRDPAMKNKSSKDSQGSADDGVKINDENSGSA